MNCKTKAFHPKIDIPTNFRETVFTRNFLKKKKKSVEGIYICMN